jgi:hypothetical protein
VFGQLHAPTALPLLLHSTADRWRIIARVTKCIVTEQRLLDANIVAPGDVEILSDGDAVYFPMQQVFVSQALGEKSFLDEVLHNTGRHVVQCREGLFQKGRKLCCLFGYVMRA